MKKVAFLFFLISTNICLSQTTVKKDGSGNFTTITAAVNAASNGDTIIVYAGTYNESVDFGGKNIVVGSLYLNSSDNSDISSTIIDGTGLSAQGVLFENGESSSARLVGFTIKNFELKGTGDGPSSDVRGGGIKINDSSPTLENLIITNNTAEWGGGIYISNSNISTTSIALKNLVITSNTADWGGGISAYITTAVLENILISENSGNTGGGIQWWGSSSSSNTQTLTNVTITNNTSSTSSSEYYGGGGVHFRHPVNMNIKNSIIWNNTSPQIKMHNDDNLAMTVGVSYSDVQGGLSSVFQDEDINTVTWSNNVDVNPEFVDPDNNDYKLKDISIAIGSGTSSGAPSTDILGNTRPNPNGSNPDMGAYENELGVNTPPNVELSLSSNNLLEYEEEIVTVTATLAYVSSQNVAITLAATGTATGSGTDYSLSSNTIEIAAGQTTSTITVAAVADEISDDGETIILDISSITNASEAIDQQKTITILEDVCANSGNSTLTGTISSNKKLYKTCSPYNLTGNVLVANGATLTIEAGVVIDFSDDYKILVKGNIISSGTSGSLITFNGNSSEGSNQMIIFKSTNLSNSTITYNVFNGPQKAIQLAEESEGNEDSTKNSGILTVTYSDFNNAGLYTKGYSSSAELKFENSTFDDLIIKGYYPRSEPITFTNCTVNNSNIDSDAYNYGVKFITSTVKNSNITMGCCSANFLFNGSVVYNSNISNGMGSPVNGLFKVVNSFFISSSINLSSSHFVSEKSIFFSKNEASDMLSIGNTEISNSSFIGYNKSLLINGIKISGRAGYNIGGNTNISYSTLLNFNSGLVFDGKNTVSIANNNIISNSLYNVKNNTSSDLILENNYWGTSTESEIQNLLYDSNEDVDKGTIDYTPFSTALNTTAPISPPSNVTKSVSGSDVVLNWTANGESDTAGYKLYYGSPTGYSYSTTVDLGNVTTYTVTGGDIATEYAITAYDSSLDGTDDMVDGNESWFSISNEVKVTLTSSDSSISEPTNSATLTATLDNTSSADITVDLTYTGTSTNATDYSGAVSITVSAGSLTGTTAITAIDDTDVEVTETIIIDIDTVSGGSENGTQQVTINLADNDLPSVSSITLDKTSIDENGGVAVITATISDVQSKDVTIPLTITGTSTIDTDYSTAFASKTIDKNAVTVAGGNGAGSTNAKLQQPEDVHVDSSGNIYISDSANNRIMKWVPGATEGTVVAGGNGIGSATNQFSWPSAIALDSSGNIYVIDSNNNRVMKWAPGATEGVVVAGGNGSGSATNQLSLPKGIYLDDSGNIYIADTSNHRVIKWAPEASEGVVVAGGNGSGSATNQLYNPSEMYLDDSGYIYITDSDNGRIMKWGLGESQGVNFWSINNPKGIHIDSYGYIYAMDSQLNILMKWNPSGNYIGQVAGSSGSGGSSSNELKNPKGIYIGDNGNIYIADFDNHRIQKTQIASEITIAAGASTGTVTFTGIQDSNKEDDETIIITPSTSPTNATSSISDALTVTIVDENFAPVATAQTDVAATEQTEVTITLAGTDSNDDTLSYIIASLPTNGTVSDNGTVIIADDLPKTTTSTDVVYVSTSDIATSDSFTFKVNDGTVDSAAATVGLVIETVNDLPTKVNLSSLTIDENASITEIGTLSTEDLDTNDTFTYELVSGVGDTDNSLFTIVSDSLKNIDAFDFETKSSYTVRVKSTDSGSASIEGAFAITVNNINDIAITSEITSTYCDGNDGVGSINITPSNTNGELSYSWTGPNGFTSTDQNISTLESGTFSVTVKDDSFEKSFDLEVQKTPIFNDLSVCYVTSDNEDFTKNRVFLSYQNIYNDSKYEILREGSSAGVFEKVGEVDSGETSFLDTTSNSASSSYSYKVRLKDNCEVTSSESSMHKTILLQSSLATDNSVNLSWTSYDGVAYSTYKIFRRVNDGSFEELISIASSNNSYNDTSADITQNSYAYYVSISITSCLTTKASVSLDGDDIRTSSAEGTSEIKSNQKFIQDDEGDYDKDGVKNLVDECPNTPEGDVVDLKGCTIFTLPINNNKVSVISASCIGTSDGSIGLSIEDASFDYSITVTGKADPIVITGDDKTASVTGLAKGTYNVCFTVTGQADYQQCFEVVIGEPLALSAFIDVDNDKRTTSIQLTGSKSYNIEVNGERFEVKDNNFNTTLPTGLNTIRISTDLDCQGVIEKEIFISEDILYYPNPTRKEVKVHVSGKDTKVMVSVFSEKGDLIYRKQQEIQDMSRLTDIDLSRQITGTYIVVMESKTVRKTFKIVKR